MPTHIAVFRGDTLIGHLAVTKRSPDKVWGAFFETEAVRVPEFGQRIGEFAIEHDGSVEITFKVL